MANNKRIEEMREQVLPLITLDLEIGTVWGVSGKEISGIAVGYKYYSAPNGKKYYVHELIAVAGGLDIEGKTVNHKDGNKLNNSFTNLEAITIGENVSHGWENGLQTGRPFRLSEKEKIQVQDLRNYGMSYRAIGKLYGVSRQTITNMVNGRTTA